MRERDLLTSPRNWIHRHPRVLPAIYVSLVITGIILTILASLVDTRFLETRTFQGSVPPLSEGREAQGVPEATYEGLGFTEARASELMCGVAVHFLTDAQSKQYQASGNLPPPQLHCQRNAAFLPGSIADVRVENQRLNASTWSFELDLFEVSRPRSYLFLPAAAVMLVGGIGLAVSFFQWALGRWLEGIRK
ncbi:MAG: hypothetical protein ACE5LS_04660 [Thermoplasmata archaeon]